MPILKDSIKNELLQGSNNILKKYKEPYIVDDIAILNTSYNINFLGNLRIYDENNLKKIKEDINNNFDEYGELKVRSIKVTPCCAPQYYHISFNIKINK